MGFTKSAFKAAGWEFEGPIPTIPKYVALAVPHTSNWDGLLLLGATSSIDLEISWMIKEQWLKGPFGFLLKPTGAVGIDRSKANNVVDQMVAEFKRRETFVLFVPPEGTRKHSATWKSGFYHIARGADVPVVPGYLDYGRKRAGLGEPIAMTGDVKADMDKIRAFYARVSPKPCKPALHGPIKLREEG